MADGPSDAPKLTRSIVGAALGWGIIWLYESYLAPMPPEGKHLLVKVAELVVGASLIAGLAFAFARI
jgi:hypothetical protein